MRRVLINRGLEWARRRGIVHAELGRRSRPEVPLVIVPPAFGVRLRDRHGHVIWGATRGLFAGRCFTEGDATPAGLLDGFRVLPGLYRHDVLGGLVRYLAAVGGYRPGEDLFVAEYDWRREIAEGARALADRVTRVRGASDQKVDLVAISSGGAVARHFLAWGGRDPHQDVRAEPGAGAAAVRRVIYLGSPQLGTFSAFSYLQAGFAFFPGARTYRAADLQRCAAAWDLLPAPGERIFLDRRGELLDLDHLEPATWRELGLSGWDRPDLAEHLDRARRSHQAIAAAAPHPPSVVIAGRHRPTATHALVRGRGAITVPCGECAGDRADHPRAFAPGDGAIPARSLAAAPGLGPDGPWWVEPSAHRRIATDPFVHPLVLDALLAPTRPVPRERYAWPLRRAG
jgi:hypothetical protein